MTMHMTTLGTSVLVFCLAQTAAAQIEKITIGQMTATIGDTAYTGATLFVPSEGTSTAEFQTFGPMTLLNIQAHDLAADNIMHNVISLEISLMGSDVSAAVTEATASWWPQGMTEPFYYSAEGSTAPQVTLETLSLDDGSARVVGQFSALLCRKDTFFAEPDADDCVQVDATFTTDLRSLG